jgi:hypothetical protein
MAMLGAGTILDPYQVVTLDDFKSVQTNLSAYYKQMNDIDFTGTVTVSLSSLSGGYDGNGFKIKNFRCTSVSRFLFSTVYGIIKNLEVDETCSWIANIGSAENGSIFASELLGNGIIMNCINRANITVSITGSAGVVCGIASCGSPTAKIIGCKNYGIIKLTSVVGNAAGITGAYSSAEAGAVEGCTNYGNIESAKNAAGIAVMTSVGANIGIINDCANYGDIMGDGSSAGISSQFAKNINRCVNTGDIVGGICAVGIACYNGTTAAAALDIKNSFALNEKIIKKSTGTGDIAAFNRIAYINKDFVFDNCYALETMQLLEV